MLLGGVSAIVGASIMIADSKCGAGLPLTVGGGVGLAGGIVMMMSSSTDFELDGNPPPEKHAARAPLGVSVRGKFWRERNRHGSRCTGQREPTACDKRGREYLALLVHCTSTCSSARVPIGES